MYYFRIELNAAAFRLAAFQLRQLRYLIWYELLQQAFKGLFNVWKQQN